MEVRPGYKHTEVGVIPEDWATQTVLGLSRQIIDYRGRTPKKLGMDWGGGDIPALSAGNVKKGFIDFSEECYFGSQALYKRWMTRGDAMKDDIIFTTEAPLGNVALIPDDKKYILSQRAVLLQIDPEQASSRYIFQFMLSEKFQRVLADYSSGSTAKGIQRKKFEQLLLATPPLSEQRAIATALAEVDALLAKLDQLIVKQRDLKQATMQQLLTGKIRLPGFESPKVDFRETDLGLLPQDWNVVEVRNVTRGHKQGYYTKDSYVESGIKLVRITDLMNPLIDYPSMPMLSISKSDYDLYRVKVGDFLFARSGAIGRYGIVYEDVDAVFGSYIIRFSFDPNQLNNEYFGYLYETSLVWKQLLSITQGSSNININAANIKSIRIPLPQLREQTSIAGVLQDIDAELAALEQRRNKTRDLKQGMMQELLTGRIRLI